MRDHDATPADQTVALATQFLNSPAALARRPLGAG